MTAVEYLDFEIEIGLGHGREYPLAVIRSPGGEAREQMIFPFDELALASRLKDLEIALLRSGGKRRTTPSTEESTVQEFGQKLFDALLSGEIRSRYDVSQREASRRGLGMRIKLRIQAPELASLPWEFLYDGRRAEYVCLSTQTPLVRYIELPQVIQPLLVAPPLCILGLTASPIGLARLDSENEKQRMENALQDLVAAGQVQITWLEHANRRDLQRTMRRGPWHILHFIGHGGFDSASDEGFIALETERGELDRLPATQLARLLADHVSLRLAVLNSCDGAQGGRMDVFSSTASVLVRRGIPAVLAMQYEITDRAAIEFARGFYEALAEDLPVDAATAEARKSVSLGLTNTIEWGTPVLFMRGPDGVLFKRPSTEELRRVAGEQAESETAEKAARQRVQDELAAVKNLAVESSLRQVEKRAAIEKARLVEERRRELNLNLGEGVTMEFVRIPAGEFWMGSDKKKDAQAYDNETPQHKVTLSEYLIGKYPVTVAQFAVFARVAGYQTSAEKEGYGWGWTGSKWEQIKGANWKQPRGPGSDSTQKDSHPVTQVSWNDATAFCQWASQMTGQSARLPSEAEWEKAARGPASGSGSGRLYPWGDQTADKSLANYAQNIGGTTPVGQYSPQGDSPYGCADMAGNVWEWCADWYAAYPGNTVSNSDYGEKYRVLRGGSWLIDESNSRVSIRNGLAPDRRLDSSGFRCAR